MNTKHRQNWQYQRQIHTHKAKTQQKEKMSQEAVKVTGYLKPDTSVLKQGGMESFFITARHLAD